jgi:hypothetical protein
MPSGSALSHLSIRSAIVIARNSVTAVRQRGGLWLVRTRIGADCFSDVVVPKAMARATRRERRIFAALVALGVDDVLASTLSVRSRTDGRRWEEIVSEYVKMALSSRG